MIQDHFPIAFHFLSICQIIVVIHPMTDIILVILLLFGWLTLSAWSHVCPHSHLFMARHPYPPPDMVSTSTNISIPGASTSTSHPHTEQNTHPECVDGQERGGVGAVYVNIEQQWQWQ